MPLYSSQIFQLDFVIFDKLLVCSCVQRNGLQNLDKGGWLGPLGFAIRYVMSQEATTVQNIFSGSLALLRIVLVPLSVPMARNVSPFQLQGIALYLAHDSNISQVPVNNNPVSW